MYISRVEGQTRDEGRELVIREGTRRGLVLDIRRAHTTIAGGLVLGGASAAMVALIAWIQGPGIIGMIFGGGAGVVGCCISLAIIVRAVARRTVARHRLRELDRQTLPAARVVAR